MFDSTQRTNRLPLHYLLFLRSAAVLDILMIKFQDAMLFINLSVFMRFGRRYTRIALLTINRLNNFRRYVKQHAVFSQSGSQSTLHAESPDSAALVASLHGNVFRRLLRLAPVAVQVGKVAGS